MVENAIKAYFQDQGISTRRMKFKIVPVSQMNDKKFRVEIDPPHDFDQDALSSRVVESLREYELESLVAKQRDEIIRLVMNSIKEKNLDELVEQHFDNLTELLSKKVDSEKDTLSEFINSEFKIVDEKIDSRVDSLERFVMESIMPDTSEDEEEEPGRDYLVYVSLAISIASLIGSVVCGIFVFS
jgi:hypothetical protein